MVTGVVRELQARDPRRVRIVYERPRWHEAWEANPRIARPEERGDFQEYRPRVEYRRPYIAEKLPNRWSWRPYAPPVGELYFTDAERAFGARHAGRIVIEPHLKPGAAVAKQWPLANWVRLAKLIRERTGALPAQLGSSGTETLPGVERILTPTMRMAAAVMANARAAVLPEGGLHHVAAAVGTPAVVIFGGYISPEVTGYAGQRSIFETDRHWPIGCGTRGRCEHCVEAMARITPERVMGELEEVLRVPAPGHLAA